MTKQITLHQLLLVITEPKNIKVFLKDINALGAERIIFDSKGNESHMVALKPYLGYVVESVSENWDIVIKGQKIA